MSEEKERIAKRLARAGLCSRRDAERWIADGRVVVNGQKLDSPAFTVGATDVILVDGNPIGEPERTRVWRYNKPAGLMTTHKDPEGRPTVFERLPEGMPRVISVGRLDYASEGLLLLTNDGELARRLELPASSWIRRYRARVHGEVEPEKLVALEKGITIDGVRYGKIVAVLDRQKGSNAWVTVSIQEGKNREVRRIFDHLGWPVLRLIRVSYGPFQLGNLPEGEVEEVPAKVFKEQLGLEHKDWAKAEERAPLRGKPAVKESVVENQAEAEKNRAARAAKKAKNAAKYAPITAAAKKQAAGSTKVAPQKSAEKRNADHRRKP